MECSSTHASSHWRPCWKCVSRSSWFISTGWPTPSSQPAICTGCWPWWCLWQHLYVMEGCASDQSSGRPPQHDARGPGTGPTGSQFLSGFYRRWPGGHLQQSCKVFFSPPTLTKTEVTLFTDASNWGWGAQLGSCSIQGQWSASQRSSHIHVLEMQAIIKLQNGYPFRVLHTALHPLESSHQGHHEKPYQQMDRGDC